MNPDPLDSTGCCCCCGLSNWRKKSSSPGGTLFRRRCVERRLWVSTWMDTTAGVTCSEIETKALLVSTSGFTSCGVGLVAPPDCCAKPSRVQSSAEATSRPPRKAPATAAPKRVREMEDMRCVPGVELYRYTRDVPACFGPRRQPYCKVRDERDARTAALVYR